VFTGWLWWRWSYRARICSNETASSSSETSVDRRIKEAKGEREEEEND